MFVLSFSCVFFVMVMFFMMFFVCCVVVIVMLVFKIRVLVIGFFLFFNVVCKIFAFVVGSSSRKFSSVYGLMLIFFGLNVYVCVLFGVILMMFVGFVGVSLFNFMECMINVFFILSFINEFVMSCCIFVLYTSMSVYLLCVGFNIGFNMLNVVCILSVLCMGEIFVIVG